MLPSLLLFIIATLASSLIFIKFYRGKNSDLIEQARLNAKSRLTLAEKEKDQVLQSANEQLLKFKLSFEELEKKTILQSEKTEKNLIIFEEKLAQKELQNSQYAEKVAMEELGLIKIENEKQELAKQKRPLLSKVSGYTEENIKAELSADLSNDLELAHETRLSKHLEYVKDNSVHKAKGLLTEAIQRFAAPTSVEKKSLLIPISKADIMQKLLSNNAEIVTYLEDQLGVDIIFNHEEDGISVGHFELVKKHIARETILKLIKDKNIDLEITKRRLTEATTETKLHLIDLGNKIVRKLDLEYRKFPTEFREILGRLRYRTSYGQNILKHCFEVGYFTLMLGNELGLSQEVCKIGGFFHDLGKAIDQEDGRPHDVLTKEIMEKFGLFSWEEIHAAWTHHDAIPIETAEALLVKAGDAISAGRPGARQETIEKYLARVMALESIANSYKGVNKTYAISGGRELRVIVDPKKLNDFNITEMAKTIAEEIEAKVAYPGQIKVNVIRRVQYNRTIKDQSKKVAK